MFVPDPIDVAGFWKINASALTPYRRECVVGKSTQKRRMENERRG
jgi:hypothetical protein